MLVPGPDSTHGAAVGLDHVGIAGADLNALAREFTALGFQLTPLAVHAGGRTANRCAMLRDGGYLELLAVVPGQHSATLDRFLARAPGAHMLALEVANETLALDRLRRAGIAAELSVTEREVASDAGADHPRARFALLVPPEQQPDLGRILLIRHLTRERLWRPDTTAHPNGAVALTEAVFASDTPAAIMPSLSRLSGRPAEPDPLGGYRVELARGRIRILPCAAAATLFPGAAGAAPLLGLTVETAGAAGVVHAGGVAIRFVAATG